MGDEPQLSAPLAWSPAIDDMLARWCDNAKCYEWMHTEAFSLYDRKAKQFMITMNSLTALSGISNVIAGGYTVNGFQIAWIFGGISIIASSLNMLQDKLGYQTSSVLHKRMAADWSTIRTQIEEVLTIPYSGRKDCRTFLKFIKADINSSSAEGNSMIPKALRDECYAKFNAIDNFDIPDICGHLEHTRVAIPTSAEHSKPLLSTHPM